MEKKTKTIATFGIVFSCLIVATLMTFGLLRQDSILPSAYAQEQGCNLDEATNLVNDRLVIAVKPVYLVSRVEKFYGSYYVSNANDEKNCNILAPTKQDLTVFIQNRNYGQFEFKGAKILVDYGQKDKSYSLSYATKFAKNNFDVTQLIDETPNQVSYTIASLPQIS